METKSNMDSTERTELYRRESRSRLTGETTMLRILSGPGGRYYYSDDIMKWDRLIYIELSHNGTSLEFPFSITDQEKMWEFVFDVWRKPEKIINYVDRFRRLIDRKLSQRKLDGIAPAYDPNSPKTDPKTTSPATDRKTAPENFVENPRGIHNGMPDPEQRPPAASQGPAR